MQPYIEVSNFLATYWLTFNKVWGSDCDLTEKNSQFLLKIGPVGLQTSNCLYSKPNTTKIT